MQRLSVIGRPALSRPIPARSVTREGRGSAPSLAFRAGIRFSDKGQVLRPEVLFSAVRSLRLFQRYSGLGEGRNTMRNTMIRRRTQVIWVAVLRSCVCGDVGRGDAGLGTGRAEEGRAGQGERRQGGGSRGGASAEPAAPQDPAVQAILESKPSTPAEFVRGAKILFDLQRPDLAEKLLQKVLDANPSDAQLADLARQFSLKTFLDFATVPELNPPARQLAGAVLTANARRSRTPSGWPS